jgi:hypothetical protein
MFQTASSNWNRSVKPELEVHILLTLPLTSPLSSLLHHRLHLTVPGHALLAKPRMKLL